MLHQESIKITYFHYTNIYIVKCITKWADIEYYKTMT